MMTCNNCGALYVTKHDCNAIKAHIDWRTEELREYEKKNRPLAQDENVRVELLKKEISQLQQMQ